MTKKIISLFLAVIMLLSLVGCKLEVDPNGTGESVSLDGSTPSDPSDPSDPSTPSDPSAPSDPSEPVDPSAPSDPVDPSEPSVSEDGGDEDQTGGDTSGSNSKEEDEDDEVISAPTSLDGLEIVKEAVKYLGTPYVYGGNSLTNGVDCSGFTREIYKKFGISLPRTAAAQSKLGTRVSLEDAKPGDLYAVAYENDSRYTGHAAIYIGDGKVIQSNPGIGITCSTTGKDTTFIRLFENTCSVSGKEAIQTLEKIAIANGEYRHADGGKYYIETQKLLMDSESPLVYDVNIGFTLSIGLIDVTNIPEGYEDLVAFWITELSNWHPDIGLYGPENPEGTHEKWGYYNGTWFSYSEYKNMEFTDLKEKKKWENGLNISLISYDDGIVFENWNREIVDLSSFPENPYSE